MLNYLTFCLLLPMCLFVTFLFCERHSTFPPGETSVFCCCRHCFVFVFIMAFKGPLNVHSFDIQNRILSIKRGDLREANV